MHAEQVVERINRQSDQPVFDPEQLDRVGRRVAHEPRTVKVFVIHDGRPRRRRRRRARGRHKRVLGAVEVFVLQPLQIVVDAVKLGVDLETLHDKLRLDAAHAQVLDVHEQLVGEQRRIRVGLVAAQVVHADRVGRQDDGQTRGDHGQRKRPVPPEFRGRRWRVRLERSDGRLVPGHVRLTFVHDRDPGEEHGGRQHPVVHGRQRRRKRGAPVIQFAYDLRRVHEIVYARGYQQCGVRVLKLVVRQIHGEHSAQSPKRPDQPHRVGIPIKPIL